MYRNVVDYIDKVSDNWQQRITEWTWDINGRRIKLDTEINPYLYFEDPYGNEDSMFGTKVTKISFPNTIKRRKWLSQHPDVRIFECNPPIRQYLLDKYDDQNFDADFARHKLRINCIDIEIEIGQEFPEPSEAKYPINVLTVYDNLDDIYYCHVIKKPGFEFKSQKKDYEGKIRNVVFIEADTEDDLLCNFVDQQNELCPDIWTGWNLDGFDTPYIMNRIIKKLGKMEASKLSPTRVIKPIDKTPRGSFRNIETWHIEGLTQIDYLPLYRHKFVMKTKQSYKLENIGMEEVGFGKLHYEGHIRDFMRNDWENFVWYNIYDVVVNWEVILKTKFLDLARTVCNMGLCEYESIFKSSPYIIGAMTVQARKNGTRLLTDNRIDKEDLIVGFQGGYVFDVEASAYHKGVSSVDLNSLYPSIMITNNISPETKIGKIENVYDDGMDITIGNAPMKYITNEQWETKIKGTCIRAANDVLYNKHTDKLGIFPQFLDMLYSARVAVKKHSSNNYKDVQVLKADTSLDESVKAAAIKQLEDEMVDDYNRQLAYKTFLNSIYGQLGSKYFPLFDLDNAEAVTKSGQHIIKTSGQFVRNYYKNVFKTSLEPIVAGDTDSLYFRCDPFVEKYFDDIPEWTRETVQLIIKDLDEFVVKLNEECTRICVEDFGSGDPRLQFARETFCSGGVFVAKKRYVLRMLDDEGKAVDKFKYAGLDVVRNELPDTVKDKMKNIIESAILNPWDSTDYANALTKIWDEFRAMTIEELAYISNNNTPKAATGLLMVEAGAQARARGVVYWNQLIEEMKLTSTCDPILPGDQLRYVYLKKTNEWGIDGVAFKDRWPPEFSEIFRVDYEKMFHKMVQDKLKHFRTVFQWRNVDPTIGEVQSVMDL